MGRVLVGREAPARHPTRPPGAYTKRQKERTCKTCNTLKLKTFVNIEFHLFLHQATCCLSLLRLFTRSPSLLLRSCWPRFPFPCWRSSGTPLVRWPGELFRASWGLPGIISFMGEACSRSRSWTRSRNRSRSGSSNRSRSRKSKKSSRARGASAGEGVKVATPANATSPAEQEEH